MHHLRLLQNFLKVNKSRLMKKCGRNHIVYILTKIIQPHWVGSRKIQWNKMTVCLYVVSIFQWRIRKILTDTIIILQNIFQTNIPNYYSNAYNKH